MSRRPEAAPPMSDDELSEYIPVRLARVVLREGSDQQWIYVEEESEDPPPHRGFPIVIGPGEAGEIHRVLTNAATPRPFTHQLAAHLVDVLGGEILGVDIVDIRNNTFYAELRLRAPSGQDEGPPPEFRVDARPSDALALALRAGAPIRVSELVMDAVRTDSAPDKLPPPSSPPGETE